MAEGWRRLTVKKLFLITFLFSIFLISGCNNNDKTIEAEGESEYWNANIIYELKTEKHDGEKIKMIYNDGKIVYLKDNPPKEIRFEYVYPSGFPSGSLGSIEHLREAVSEFSIGGGGSSINKGDTYASLREKIDEARILVKWKINNQAYEEEIQLIVVE